MQSPFILFIVFVAVSLTSCTEKHKDTQEPQRIKREQTAPATDAQPVQIPMHGTKENSSSGITTFKIKEDMKENTAVKNTTQD
ncbi:hypothetical protein [Myroides odoratus]|uniref:hypothetical protein n=1 Tax=Myroides odoratus TaxID=256 RepID=UPI0039AFFF23